MDSIDILDRNYSRANWTDHYKQLVFAIWYKQGKPEIGRLHQIIPLDEFLKKKPSIPTLRKWRTFFLAQAQVLDEQVEQALKERLVAEKVEMMNRHADAAKTAQKWSLDWLQAHANDLNANAAIRLWVEAVRIERESKGVPEAWDKIGRLSDEGLMQQILEVLKGAPPTLEPNSVEISEEEIIDV